MQDTPDLNRRFGGVGRLYGDAALARFQVAHVCVIGIGGVGSWAVEALARSAIGKLTLVDLDNVAESNVNRQIHALGNEFGKAKVTAMAERVRLINPSCEIIEIEDFVTSESAADLVASGFDVIVDAIDDSRAKTALIAACHAAGMPLVTTGAAGGRVDPTQVRVADLSKTEHDNLLARVRKQLRIRHRFPRAKKGAFGIRAVYSMEAMAQSDDESECEIDLQCDSTNDATPQQRQSAGLACTGYGSAVTVTASFGFAAAAEAMRLLSASTAA